MPLLQSNPGTMKLQTLLRCHKSPVMLGILQLHLEAVSCSQHCVLAHNELSNT